MTSADLYEGSQNKAHSDDVVGLLRVPAALFVRYRTLVSIDFVRGDVSPWLTRFIANALKSRFSAKFLRNKLSVYKFGHYHRLCTVSDIGNGWRDPRERVGLKAQYATLEQAQVMQQEACGRPAVLVVEDEILLRWTTVSMIDETGFNAFEAGSAVEAISMLERRNDVWAVVTDVQMPGSIDGLKLAHLIKIRWPKVKIIVTSGQLRLREDDLPAGADTCTSLTTLRN